MWTIKRIDEADFGCEERLPGEPLMVLVSLRAMTGELYSLRLRTTGLQFRNFQRVMSGRRI